MPADNKYLLQPSIQQLHDDANVWLSELEFYKTELSFLSKIFEKYFLRIKGNYKLIDLITLELRVKSFRSKKLADLYKDILDHENHLSDLEADLPVQDEQATREEHKKHEEDFREFTGEVKNLKREVFSFVEKELKIAANGGK
ncbi:MAG: hypothetical protein NT126_04395 [Bacteroidetes bacterium]|nr:hypothetical protein [Bacteroidota bacterium]